MKRTLRIIIGVVVIAALGLIILGTHRAYPEWLFRHRMAADRQTVQTPRSTQPEETVPPIENPVKDSTDELLFRLREEGNTDIQAVRWLLKAGADPNATDSRGETSLILALRQVDAIMENDLTLVRILLYVGANPNVPDEGNITPVLHAASNGRLEILKLLFAHRASTRDLPNLLSSAPVRHKKYGVIIELLLKNGAPADSEDGRLALRMAQKAKQYEVVKLLESAVAKERSTDTGTR